MSLEHSLRGVLQGRFDSFPYLNLIIHSQIIGVIMKFKIHKIRALDYYFKLHTVRSATNAGYWVEFKLFSLILITKSHTIIFEV